MTEVAVSGGFQIAPTTIDGLKVVTPKIHRDARGFFSETYNGPALASGGVDFRFVQDNHSLSAAKGVVRGLHYQCHPRAQTKLVRVTRGAILDVAVDIRWGAPTFGKYFSIELSAENWSQLLIPAGFAHGFCTLVPNTEVIYKVTDVYAPDCDRGIAWNDPDIGIAWPVAGGDAILSDKDRRNPMLRDSARDFIFGE